MILQALTKLYEDLAEQGKIAREGWNAVKISYLLEIDEDGRHAAWLYPSVQGDYFRQKDAIRADG